MDREEAASRMVRLGSTGTGVVTPPGTGACGKEDWKRSSLAGDWRTCWLEVDWVTAPLSLPFTWTASTGATDGTEVGTVGGMN